MKSGDIKLILLHGPADLIDEVDELCELNYVNRTEFILFAIDSMTDFCERRRQRADRDLLDGDAYCPIPGDGITSISIDSENEAEDDELLLTAAEDEDEDNHSIFFSDKPGDGTPEGKHPE